MPVTDKVITIWYSLFIKICYIMITSSSLPHRPLLSTYPVYVAIPFLSLDCETHGSPRDPTPQIRLFAFDLQHPFICEIATNGVATMSTLASFFHVQHASITKVLQDRLRPNRLAAFNSSDMLVGSDITVKGEENSTRREL